MAENTKTSGTDHSVAHNFRESDEIDLGNADDESLDEEFRRALRTVDLDRCNPLPPSPTRWNSYARALYLQFVAQLKDAIERTNLLNAAEFHRLLWLCIRLGGEQQFVANAQHVPATVVSRWFTGKQTPEPLRRRMILEAALVSLTKNIEAGVVVPMIPGLAERGARRALHSESVQIEQDGHNIISMKHAMSSSDGGGATTVPE